VSIQKIAEGQLSEGGDMERHATVALHGLAVVDQTAFVPHSGQNFAPLSAAPQFAQLTGAGAARSILVPHSGQNFAP
jgi:hypothetical protein